LNDSDPFAVLYLRIDDQVLVNTRKAYGLLDWLSSVGGFATSIMGVLGLVSFYLSYQLFISVVLDNLFFVKKGLFSKADEDPKKLTPGKGGKETK